MKVSHFGVRVGSSLGQIVSLRRNLLLSGAVCGLTATVPSAWAQAEGQEVKSEEIIVTGSRINRPGFESPTPLIALDREDLDRMGGDDIASAINDVPAVKASVTPETSPGSSATLGGNFLDLRGLGYTRTLTLIEGQRYVPSSISGGVNMYVVPQALVSGVDIVTGGASAAYGSDAVAGVVNVRLNDKLVGVRGSLQGSITGHNDNRRYTLSVGGGLKFADGRGHIIVGLDKSERSGIPLISDRDWGRRAAYSIANPEYVAGNGKPQYLFVDDVRSSIRSYGGVINSPTRLTGIQFAPDGTPVPFIFGDLRTSSLMRGGDGTPTVGDAVLVSPVKRVALMSRLTFDLSPRVTAFVQGSFARTEVVNASITGNDSITIRRDNAYLPESIRSVMEERNINSFGMGRSLNDYARGTIENDTKTWQVTTGLRGRFGDGWSWDASYGYGETSNFTLFRGARITSNFNLAVDAVINPYNGSIVCRSALTNPTNGCMPLNLFGVGNASPQAIAYITGDSPQLWRVGQHAAQFSVNGEPFSTWAGPVSVAFGAEWRHESDSVTSDAASEARIYRVGNAIPWENSQSVKEAFVETVVPILEDSAIARSMELNGAFRVTDYSVAGTASTWKAGLTWEVNSWLRLRGTRSRDIRAPSMSSLFSRGSTLYFTVNDPELSQSYSVLNISGGNTSLRPEKADTLTFGAIFSPSSIPGLQFSVDYYDINIKEAIASITAASAVLQCYRGSASACLLVTRDPSTREITQVLTASANLQNAMARGIDFEVAYRHRVGPGRLSLRAMATYTDSLRLVGPDTDIDYAGSIQQATVSGMGGRPHWRGNGSANFVMKRYSVGVAGRYVGGGLRSIGVSIDKPEVTGRFYTDINGQVTLFQKAGQRVALSASVRNLFDKDPPLTSDGTARAHYDTIGRTYTATLRFNF